MNTVLFYEYANCSTCKKAKKWLQEQRVVFKAISIVDTPPTYDELVKHVRDSGLELKKFFNTSGESYRKLGLSTKLAKLSPLQQMELLANDGKLIKRPLLVKGTEVLVGFKEDEYAKTFK